MVSLFSVLAWGTMFGGGAWSTFHRSWDGIFTDNHLQYWHSSHLWDENSQLCSGNACMIRVSEWYWNKWHRGGSTCTYKFPPENTDIWFSICFLLPPIYSHLGCVWLSYWVLPLGRHIIHKWGLKRMLSNVPVAQMGLIYFQRLPGSVWY